MRHGVTSALLADGATPAVVQKQRITLGVYGHVIGNQQREAVGHRRCVFIQDHVQVEVRPFRGTE
jgi:hypothetical protein